MTFGKYFAALNNKNFASKNASINAHLFEKYFYTVQHLKNGNITENDVDS